MFLGECLFTRNLVDNAQARAACDKGYSKRLRYLARTHRVALGVMHDLLHDPEQRIIGKEALAHAYFADFDPASVGRGRV